MSDSERKTLRQTAYPSAFAFDRGTTTESAAEAQDSAVFGASAPLPGLQRPEAGQSPAEQLGVPVVSLDKVRDPQLRDSLQAATAGAQGAAATDEESAAGRNRQQPAAASGHSPFEPVSEPQQVQPLTAALPVISADTPQPAATGAVTQAAYPSAELTSPLTAPGGLPTAKPGWVKSSFRSFVHADRSLTKPMRGMARLAQRQFAATQRERDRQDYVREKEQAREILNFTLRLSETMFHYGADTVDVDSAIVSVCAAYGLDDVEVDITNQSVIINYVSDIDDVDLQTRALNTVSPDGEETKEERFSHTVMRVVRSSSDNYAALDDIYKLIYDITQNQLPRGRAERRLLKINEAKKPYSPLVLMLANIVTASSLTIGIGGSPAAGVAAGLAFLTIYFVDQLIARLNMPSFFNMAAGAGVVTFFAIYMSGDSSPVAQMGVSVAAPHIVAAGLIMLLPTSKLVSSVQDALNGFPLTAAGKVVSTGMSFLGIVVGLASAVAVLSAIGVSELKVEETVFNPPNLWTNYVFMVLASVAIGVTMHARLRTLLWVVLISTCGIAVYDLFTHSFGAGAGRANTAVAAMVIGLLSTYLAYRLHAPAAIFYVPGLTFLLPGLSIFRGLYMFTVEADSVTGVPGMVTAVGIVVSMASGVVLGSYIMQNIVQRALRPRREAGAQQTGTHTLDR